MSASVPTIGQTVDESACAEAERRLQEYVDRCLTREQVVAIEAHLAACPRCSNCYAFEQEVRAHVRAACAEPCPEALKLRLRKLCTDCE